MKTFRLNAIVLAMVSTLALAACSSNSSSVTGGNSTTTSSSSSSTTTSSSSSSSTSSANSSSSGSSTTNPNVSPVINTTPTTSTELSTAIQKGFGGTSNVITRQENGRYGVDIISINKDGTISQQFHADDGKDAKSFTLNNKIQIDLLNDGSDKVSGVTVRQFKNQDFADATTGTINEAYYNSSNPGWVGSITADYALMYGIEQDVAGNYKNLRYGVYNDPDGNSHLFVFGKPATEAGINAKTDTVYYSGSAIVGKDGKYEGLSNALSGSVNFGSKDVSLTIKRNEGNLNFGGKINGNTFEGTQNNVYTKGGLYGDINATSKSSNIGGMFTVVDGAEKGLNGVYGGTEAEKE